MRFRSTRPDRLPGLVAGLMLLASLAAPTAAAHDAPDETDGPVFDTEVEVEFHGRRAPVSGDETLDHLRTLFGDHGRPDLAERAAMLYEREIWAIKGCLGIQTGTCLLPAAVLAAGAGVGAALIPVVGGTFPWSLLGGIGAGCVLSPLALVAPVVAGVWLFLYNAVDYWEVRALVDDFNRTARPKDQMTLFIVD